jgi:hypothetical protein
MKNDFAKNKSPWIRIFCGCALLLPLISGCGIKSSIDDVISEVEKARQSAVEQSDAWRAALPKLADQLGTLESQVAADAKSVVADTRNQVQELTQETIKYANLNAQQIIAKTGVEFRCNTDFALNGVAVRLQYLIDDLKFWKKNKHHLDQKPAHKLCQILGEVLTLYPIGNGQFGLDSSKLIEKGIVGVFGYNFRADALPHLQLVNSGGSRIRDLKSSLAYVTQYQLNIDLSQENFAGAASGEKIRLIWPDGGELNEISLSMLSPAKLKIVGHEFAPAAPIMQKTAVTLSVTIENTGGAPSGGFVVNWTPPDGARVQSVSQAVPLNPKETRKIAFPGTVVYQSQGSKENVIAINNGDDTEKFFINVDSNIASAETHRIDKPPVTKPWSATTIHVQAGDKVEILDAGGCVNTGGSGATTKRYVDPLNPDCKPDSKYFGTLAIPGTLEESQRKSIKDILDDQHRGRFITVSRPATLELGYVDDGYSDNGYWGMGDQGNCEQCRGAGNAFVVIKVTHFK